MGRFLSPKDMSAAKHEMEVYNSLHKRGMIRSPDKIVREMHVVCGCGVEGCLFISAQRDESDEERERSIAEHNKRMGYL